MALLFVSLASVVAAEVLVRGRLAQARALQSRQEENEERNTASQSRGQEKKKLEALTRLAAKMERPSVPSLFVRHLAETLPESLTLTSLELERTSRGWLLNLEGTTTNSAAALVPVFQKFEEGLTNGVFQVQVTNSVARQLFAAKLGGPTRTRATPRGEEPVVFLEGLIP